MRDRNHQCDAPSIFIFEVSAYTALVQIVVGTILGCMDTGFGSGRAYGSRVFTYCRF